MPLAFSQWHLYRLDFMVEARGVEPLSENASTGTSPGADGTLHSLAYPCADTLADLVES